MLLQNQLNVLVEKIENLQEKIDATASVKHALSLLLTLTFFSFAKPTTNVFICKGKSSTKYHYIKACRGLSNCSTKTYEVTLTKAKEMGRTLCGWED